MSYDPFNGKVMYCEGLPPINPPTRPFEQLIFWGHVANKLHYIYTCRRPRSTKLGKVDHDHYQNNDRISRLKSHHPLITWPTCGYLVVWKNCISWPQDLAGWRNERSLSTQTLNLSPTSCSYVKLGFSMLKMKNVIPKDWLLHALGSMLYLYEICYLLPFKAKVARKFVKYNQKAEPELRYWFMS